MLLIQWNESGEQILKIEPNIFQFRLILKIIGIKTMLRNEFYLRILMFINLIYDLLFLENFTT